MMLTFDSGQLRMARRANKMSINYAAAKLGMSPSALSSRENGKVKVLAEELPQLADVYDVNLSYFFKEVI